MLLDYAREYADTPFGDKALNVLDLLAFSGLSYFDFPSESWGLTLPEAMSHVTHFTEPRRDASRERLISLETGDDEELRALVSKSSRYADVRVLGFASDFESGSHQFGAVSLLIGDVLILAYRGTDESITGWEEALKLSLDTPGQGQLLASSFFAEQAAVGQGPIITCGHSKGGNLAAYAAVSCAADSVIANRIAAVATFDGPRLSPRMRATEAFVSIRARILAYVPKSSFIGNIYERSGDDIDYVDSDEVFLAQHVIYSWKTKGTSLVTCRQSLAGKLGSAAIGFLVDTMNDVQKTGLFDALFWLPRKLSGK